MYDTSRIGIYLQASRVVVLSLYDLLIDLRAVLCEIARQDNGNETEPEKSELLHELSTRLDWAGISDPHNKVYIKPPKMDNIALVVFLFTVSQLNKLFYCKNTG